MQTKSKIALYTLGIAGTVAALTYNTILNYNIPAMSYECLGTAKEKIIQAEIEYEHIYDLAIQQSYDTLKTNPTYVKLSNELQAIETKLENGDDYTDIANYVILEVKADSIAQELRAEHINKNKAFVDARTSMDQAYEKYERIVRAQAVADSIRKNPIKTRLRDNWRQICIDLGQKHK